MDRRRNRRKKHRLSVRLEPGSVSSVTGDLTPEGLFVYSARVHKPGTRVRVVLRLAAGADAEAHGVVRWARRVPTQFLAHVRGGMGIEFTWISPELQAYLEAEGEVTRAAV